MCLTYSHLHGRGRQDSHFHRPEEALSQCRRAFFTLRESTFHATEKPLRRCGKASSVQQQAHSCTTACAKRAFHMGRTVSGEAVSRFLIVKIFYCRKTINIHPYIYECDAIQALTYATEAFPDRARTLFRRLRTAGSRQCGHRGGRLDAGAGATQV